MVVAENILILDSVRSAQNVGTIWRTADAAGIAEVWLCGLTPSLPSRNDPRPTYVQERAAKLIAKTALGAEQSVPWHYFKTLDEAITAAREQELQILALEQSEDSTPLFCYHPAGPWALVVGHEVNGVQSLDRMDAILELPMHGTKESLNVAVAAGIALYHLTRK